MAVAAFKCSGLLFFHRLKQDAHVRIPAQLLPDRHDIIIVIRLIRLGPAENFIHRDLQRIRNPAECLRARFDFPGFILCNGYSIKGCQFGQLILAEIAAFP